MRLLDLLLPVVALIILAVLLRPKIRKNLFWQATVTPLASIIGSGFLIVAPLLGGIVGAMTPWAMLLIVVFAYLIGSVIRFNIRHVEPLLSSGGASSGQRFFEQLSNLTLFSAYVISSAFYLKLMSVFVLRGLGWSTLTNANVLTTGVLLFIGLAGWRRGLKALELLEEYAVSAKLAVIGGFLLALCFYDVANGQWGDVQQPRERPTVEILRLLAGMLLVVQGFETSRYLGQEHPAERRARSMQFAQCLSAIIYVGFAFLILPLLHYLPSGDPDESAIIDLSRHVSIVLPVMLIAAAAMSQFSAAVADTLGGGGLLVEESRGWFSPRYSYLMMSVCAIILIWSTSIFEIVAYASRAFAFYYFAQTIIAFQAVITWPSGWKKCGALAGFGVLAVVLALVTLFAIPAD